MRSLANAALTIGLLVAQSGCVTSGQPSRESAGLALTSQRRQADRLDAMDLQQVEAATLADAIRQLRPEFFTPRPPVRITGPLPTSVVYVNGQYQGGLEMLSTIPLPTVVEVTRLSSTLAKSRYGSFCPCDGGVVDVKVRAP